MNVSDKKEDTLKEIYDQLAGGEADLYSSRDKSIKYYLRSISSKLDGWIRSREQDDSRRTYSTNWSLGILAVVALFLIQLGSQESSDFEWIETHQLVLKLWGVILAAVYVGASIERSEIFKSLWTFSITKLITSIAASGLVIYSTGKAAGVINGVFGVDATTFSITMIFTTAIVLFNLIAPFLAFISAGVLLHLINVAGWIKSKINGDNYEFPPFHSFMFSITASTIMFFGWNWSSDELSEERLPEKVYLMAYALDFNFRHLCEGIDKDFPVVFLGPSQQSVLVAPSKLEYFDFSTFFSATVEIPNQFYRLECKHQSNP